MKHAPSTIDYLRKFCDGTGLGPFEIDELKAAGFIAQNPQDKSWFVTTTGHVAMQGHNQHQLDWARNQPPLGEGSTQCPDDDSYLPPKQVLSPTSALDRQVQGTHYKGCTIQPIEYIHANKLGYIEGNVVKYITRHTSKGGAGDVRKAIHYCELVLQLQYGEKA